MYVSMTKELLTFGFCGNIVAVVVVPLLLLT